MIVVEHSAGIVGKNTGYVLDLRQGVTLFFVLSGFIMVYAHPRLTGFQIPTYWYARFARLWPVQAFMLVVTILLPVHQTWVVPHPFAVPLILQVLLLQAWVPTAANINAFNAVTWTLSVEMLFYLLFPLLLWRLRQLWWLEATIAAIVTFLVAVTFNAWLVEHLSTNAGIGFVWPPARVFDFVLGMCTAVAFEKLSGRRVARNLATAFELAAIVLAVAAVACTYELAALFDRVLHPGLGAILWFKDVGAVCFPFAVLILILALDWGHVARALSWKPLITLGESSYSLYLVHYPLVLVALVLIPEFAPAGLPRLLAYAAFFALTLGAALLLWICIERPCRRLLIDLWSRRFGDRLALSNSIGAGGLVASADAPHDGRGR